MELNQFIHEFEKAANSNNTVLLMTLMDGAYRKEQHDHFLQGNTIQFINEFFCGTYITDKEGKTQFDCPGLNTISDVKTVNITPSENGYKYIFKFKSGGKTYTSQRYISVKVIDNKRQFGLVGAVG